MNKNKITDRMSLVVKRHYLKKYRPLSKYLMNLIRRHNSNKTCNID